MPSEFPAPSFPAPEAPSAPTPEPPPGGWAVAAGRGAHWWADGWRLFLASPWAWLALTVLFGAINVALMLVPLVGSLASTLANPVFAGGVLLGARAVDRGLPLKVGTLFACFGDRLAPLAIVALVYFAGWVVVSGVVVAILVGGVGLGALSAALAGDPLDAGLAALLGFGATSVAALLACVVLVVPMLMAYWFAPALVVFRGDAPLAAMKESFRANLRNVPPFLVYGLVGVGLSIAASIPFLLGWLVLGPVFAGSVYASYKDIFGDPGA